MFPNRPPARKKTNLIYGIHAVEEALEAGREIDQVLIRKDAQHESIAHLRRELKLRSIPYSLVPGEKLDRLCPGKTHQGVAAFLSEIIYQPLDEWTQRVFEEGKTPLFVLLDGVTDVRNMGAIARSMECFGANGLVLPATGSARLNEDAMKTSAGALNFLTVCRAYNLAGAARFLKKCGLQVVACTEHSDENIENLDLTGPLALVFGAEGSGVSDELLSVCDATCAIPLRGRIESLNVSVAVGVSLYEVNRQNKLANSAGNVKKN